MILFQTDLSLRIAANTIPQEAVPYVRALLDQQLSPTRDGASIIVGLALAGVNRDPLLVPSVAKYIGYKELDIWDSAITAVQLIGGPAATEVLIEAFYQTQDKVKRKQIISALGELKDPSAVPLLIELIDRAHPTLGEDTLADRVLRSVGGAETARALVEHFYRSNLSSTRQQHYLEIITGIDSKIGRELATDIVANKEKYDGVLLDDAKRILKRGE